MHLYIIIFTTIILCINEEKIIILLSFIYNDCLYNEQRFIINNDRA